MTRVENGVVLSARTVYDPARDTVTIDGRVFANARALMQELEQATRAAMYARVKATMID